MIRFSVLYPATDGATFDHDYYRDMHVPLAAQTWNPTATRSTSRSTARTSPPSTSLRVDGGHAGGARVGRHRGLGADVPNYTTITPVRQVSEIVSSSSG